MRSYNICIESKTITTVRRTLYDANARMILLFGAKMDCATGITGALQVQVQNERSVVKQRNPGN